MPVCFTPPPAAQAHGNDDPHGHLSFLTVALLALSAQSVSAAEYAAPGSSADKPGSTLQLQQVTISATRREQDVVTVPSTVSVHEREELDRQNVNTLKDLVRYEPGVSVGGAGQRGGISGYNIRGIDGSRILTQIDGVSTPDGFSNGPYAKTQRNYVDPEIIKRVEILRGPASVLYGSNAIGGAVSYFTLDPDDIIKPGAEVGARLKSGYSSADSSWLKSATLAGRQEQFDALLHLSQRDGHETQSHGRNNSEGLSRSKANPEDARTTNVLSKLGWNYGENERFGLVYEHYKNDRDTDQRSAVGGPFTGGHGRGMYRSRLGNDTVTRERFGLEHRFTLDSLLADQMKWSLNHQTARTDQGTLEDYFAHTRRVMRARNTQYQDRQWVLDAQLDKAFALGPTEHHLTYGTTLKQQKVSGARSGSGTCLEIGVGCRAVGANSPKDYLKKVSDFPDPTINTYSLFAQDEISWKRWTFIPGLRYDYTRLKPHLTQAFLEAAGPEDKQIANVTQTWHRLSPKFGLTYALSEQYTGYGQYAEGFRTPSAKALYGRFESPNGDYRVEPNPNLQPEKSKSYETGLRGRFDSGSFDVALFYNQYRDFINEDSIKLTAGQPSFQSTNIKRATIKGAEAKGRLQLDVFGAPQGLYTQGAVAYAQGRNQDNGQPINSVNPLTGVFGLGYEQAQYGGLLSWTLVKKKNRVDDTQIQNARLFRTPGYSVLDLSGFYKVTRDLTVNAGLYNLGDKKYWRWDDLRSYDSTGESAVTNPANLDRLTQPGRNFAVNLVWDI